MSTAALIAKAKRYASMYGEDAIRSIENKCHMLLACERQTRCGTAAVRYKTELERFVAQQEAKVS